MTQKAMKRIPGVSLIIAMILLSGCAKQMTQKADGLYDRGLYNDAMVLYKKAYARHGKKEDKAIIAWKIGESYRMQSDAKEAANWYEKSYTNGNKSPELLWAWANAIKMTGRYDEAIARFNEYKTANPGDARVNPAITSCQQAQAWKDKPTRFKVENVAALNSKYFDFAVTQNPNAKNGIYMTSSREAASGTKNDGWYGQKFFDLFSAEMDNNARWSTPVPLPPPLNSPASEGAATFDATGKTLYFTRCEERKGTIGYCKIYKSTLGASGWSTPEGLPINSDEYSVGHPSLSQDGKTLYFCSDMPGGKGGKDIYMMKWDDATNSWAAPVNMGPAINTEGDEMYPYLHPNGKLYFASNGHAGMGGLDIFSATHDGNAWVINNLRSPINSPADDFGIIFTDATSGFLSSNREGGMGSDDIYAFLMPPPNFSVYGRVYDTDTKESIAGAVVELFGSDGTALSVKTEAAGTYRYALKPNVKYKISASYTGYLTKFAEVSTVGLDESEDFEENFDFPLKSTAKPITLPEIFYDLDKATLRPESKKALDGLIQVLNDNPTITIKLTAHTDYRASDEYNIRLSHRRAKSVVDYLIQHGIDPERLSSEGKGETTPKEVENDEDYPPFKRGDRLTKEFIDALPTKELREIAHQYNRRTEFEVLRTDYVPRKKKK
jgi:peptidoglycan-associated lipoprotein